MINRSLNNWKVFASLLEERCGAGMFDGSRYIFRGQANADWALEPSYDRFSKDSLVLRERGFNRVLERFRDMLLYRGEKEFAEPELIGLAQHYELPTRILDWSNSPYVGLFFACAEALVRGFPQAALFILDVTRLRENVSEAELRIISYYPGTNERLRNQRGCYTALLADYRTLEAFLSHRDIEDIVCKLFISKDVFAPALRHLASMDISYDRLFPGIPGIAKQAWLEELLA